VIEELKKYGREDIMVVVGGVIPSLKIINFDAMERLLFWPLEQKLAMLL
jgi:methylmalonyl-CoA mutase cobalamin-binding subunit